MYYGEDSVVITGSVVLSLRSVVLSLQGVLCCHYGVIIMGSVVLSLRGVLLQGVLGGVLRGCGKQFATAVTNVVSFHLIGVPLSLTLVYAAHMGALGYMIGSAVGSVTQVLPFIKLSIITVYGAVYS